MLFAAGIFVCQLSPLADLVRLRNFRKKMVRIHQGNLIDIDARLSLEV